MLSWLILGISLVVTSSQYIWEGRPMIPTVMAIFGVGIILIVGALHLRALTNSTGGLFGRSAELYSVAVREIKKPRWVLLPIGVFIGTVWSWIAPEIIPLSWRFGLPIRQEFKVAYERNRGKLGDPLQLPGKASLEWKSGRGLAQGSFDHATLIWLDNPGVLYAIPKDRNIRSIITVEPDHYGPGWTMIDSEIRKRTPFDAIPLDCNLPRGGFITHWQANPNDWSWIGCGEWYLELDASKTYFQEFANGRIIGPLRVWPNNDTGEIYTIFNNGDWDVSRTEEKAPKVIDQFF